MPINEGSHSKEVGGQGILGGVEGSRWEVGNEEVGARKDPLPPATSVVGVSGNRLRWGDPPCLGQTHCAFAPQVKDPPEVLLVVLPDHPR